MRGWLVLQLLDIPLLIVRGRRYLDRRTVHIGGRWRRQQHHHSLLLLILGCILNILDETRRVNLLLSNAIGVSLVVFYRRRKWVLKFLLLLKD